METAWSLDHAVSALACIKVSLPHSESVVNRKDREAQILRRAYEIATTGKHVGRYFIEAKLRFEPGESPGIEILADPHFSAELDRICAEASIL